MIRRPPRSTLFPTPTLFRSSTRTATTAAGVQPRSSSERAREPDRPKDAAEISAMASPAPWPRRCPTVTTGRLAVEGTGVAGVGLVMGVLSTRPKKDYIHCTTRRPRHEYT